MNTLDNYKFDALNQIAYQAGEAIMKIYEGDKAGFEVEYKDDRSPLTIADRLSHELIEAGLKKLHPEIPVLSEESDHVAYTIRRSWSKLWLVDPLDGTKQFVARQGEFTVNIALIEENKPVLGIIYSPTTQALYYAAKEKGAYRVLGDGEPERLPSKHTPLPGELKVIGSRSHVSAEFEAFVNEQREKYESLELVNIGSSLKFCLIAEGKADIYPRFGPTMEWDTAAAQIIVQECGRNIYHAETGNELTYNKENLLNPGFICR
ncbi:MAG: 3'(2'),5'-bisphosphate nucleotidase CysQ [Candidatus Caenarcaniphilales bacterium]|nr:3'(2'),5'-bisphosphate nucleotidase CysQ [Candidatus Caenarcaniphilales bacterium]